VYSFTSLFLCSLAEGLYLRAKINFGPLHYQTPFLILHEKPVHEDWGYILFAYRFLSSLLIEQQSHIYPLTATDALVFGSIYSRVIVQVFFFFHL